MAISDQRSTLQPEMLFLGTIPPPATGMTLMTKEILQALRAARELTFYNWSPGMSRPGFRFRIRRSFRILRSLWALVERGRVRDARLYLVANSSTGGLVYTCALASAARWFGYQTYLHHHAYSYIDQFNRWMSWTDRAIGADGVHIVHCDKMVRDFSARYATKASFITIFPSIVSLEVRSPRSDARRPFRLGHMSNLTVEKGLDLVVDVFRGLRSRGQPVSLTLAGPCQTADSRDIIEKALAEFGDNVRYLGPIYDDDKDRFFADIDAFLFPTRYKNESWGIVLNEALAAAVPVIACDRGCVATVVGEAAGIVVDRDANFERISTESLIGWIENPTSYAAASAAAVKQAEHLHREAAAQLQHFVQRMCQPLQSNSPV